MKGKIFDIQRFSIHDGPGIRTTVFFKGCNLACFWCHNPESIAPRAELQFQVSKCIACGICEDACPEGCHKIIEGLHAFDRTNCAVCGKCALVCPFQALSMMGKDYTSKEILDIVMRDNLYYKNSGGGMTCSGGEPMIQHDFLRELLGLAKDKGLHTAVDTAGNVPFEWFEQILGVTDLFLYDLKSMDSKKHLEATGVGNERILVNLEKLSRNGANIWVRIPLIPTVNDSIDNMQQTADYLSSLAGVAKVELLTFHRLGGGKYESLGKQYTARDILPLSNDQMNDMAKPFYGKGFEVKVS